LGRKQSTNPWTGKHPAHANGYAVHEIATRDVAVHAKVAIARSPVVVIL
jgi:hypothetical protein